MKGFFLFIYFIFCFLLNSAQDTIYLKNSEKAVVFIKENLRTEVHYTKTSLPHATTYIVNKNDIEKIVFYNTITNTINRDIISYQDTKGRYYHLSDLIHKNQNPDKKPLLFSYAKSIANLNYAQNATRTAAVCFGVFGFVSTMAILNPPPFTNYSRSDFTLPTSFFALCLITSASSITFHVKLANKRDKFVDYYNQ